MPAIAAALFLCAFPLAAQTGNPAPAAHPATPHHAAPAASTPASPNASNASAPGESSSGNPSTPGECEGESCEASTPHISIATPAPAPAPWPWQDRIRWAAEILLLLIAYIGIMLAVSALRKIERQARYAETTAQAAAETAKTALAYVEAQTQSERPWILVTAEPAPGAADVFSVVATNRGRSPAKVTTLSDGIIFATDEAHMQNAPAYKSGEPRAPLAALILLPGESTDIKTFRRDDVKMICESPEHLRRVEDWTEKIYLYGVVTYVDLRSPDEKQQHETRWCCWYIHGRQKSGMVMTGPQEYNRHS